MQSDAHPTQMLATKSLFEHTSKLKRPMDTDDFLKELKEFGLFGRKTDCDSINLAERKIPVFRNEFWTSRQRACHSIHEVSYRACFKPQLPEFFISRFCNAGDVVYDPFTGRGTTLIEARLNSCSVIGNDINPLSQILTEPRLNPPSVSEVKKRLDEIYSTFKRQSVREDLKVFYHEKTLEELCSLRKYFKNKRLSNKLDQIDKWILMVATNRLTGHSKGFFSVYTLPPNQAATIESQKKINERLNQKPEYRNTKEIIIKKTCSLLADPFVFSRKDLFYSFHNSSADSTFDILSNSVDLVVTSPPFLDIVNYISDNWLRIWFTESSFDEASLWQIKSPEQWADAMKNVFLELKRLLKQNRFIAFEVGEVRNSSVELDHLVCKSALDAQLEPVCIMRNEQSFTKTSNCWGVKNNKSGTNSNRIVVVKKT